MRGFGSVVLLIIPFFSLTLLLHSASPIRILRRVQRGYPEVWITSCEITAAQLFSRKTGMQDVQDSSSSTRDPK